MRKLNINFGQAAEVRYRPAIINADGSVAKLGSWKRNLLLDTGLDGIALRSWADAFTHCVIGTGTAPTKRDSGAITFSLSGSTVTASASFFEAADVGRLLKFDTGEEMYVTGFTDSQTVAVGATGTLAASEGTVWYVNATGHQTETKRSASYATDVGANGSSYLAGVYTHKRTFVFSAEVATITYREIGWSHTASAGGNLLGRDLIPGAGDTLVSGQQYRVEVQLSVTYSPASPQVVGAVITGWTQAGSQQVEAICARLVGADGNTANPSTGSSSIDPATGNAKNIYVSTVSTALNPAGTANFIPSGGTSANKAATIGAYTSGTFSRTYSVTFATTEANFAIRSLWLAPSSVAGSFFRVLLDAAETKASTHTLTLTFRLSWGRVLQN